MSNKKHEEYLSPNCRIFHFEMAGNVMSPNPEIGIDPWEEGEEI